MWNNNKTGGGGGESVCGCFSHIEQGLLLQCKNSYQIRSCCEGQWNECNQYMWLFVMFILILSLDLS